MSVTRPSWPSCLCFLSQISSLYFKKKKKKKEKKFSAPPVFFNVTEKWIENVNNSFPAGGEFCRLLITFANSLDLDQAR